MERRCLSECRKVGSLCSFRLTRNRHTRNAAAKTGGGRLSQRLRPEDQNTHGLRNRDRSLNLPTPQLEALFDLRHLASFDDLIARDGELFRWNRRHLSVV